MDPDTVPDVWRIAGKASVWDVAGDSLYVIRYGARIDLWSERGNHVVIPADCDAETLAALESVVAEMQAFLQTARAR